MFIVSLKVWHSFHCFLSLGVIFSQRFTAMHPMDPQIVSSAKADRNEFLGYFFIVLLLLCSLHMASTQEYSLLDVRAKSSYCHCQEVPFCTVLFKANIILVSS